MEHDSLPIIRVTLTFFASENGGRSRPAYDDERYRPHLVVGNPERKVAMTDAQGQALEEYLGVAFCGDGRPLPFGVPHEVALKLVYHPRADYGRLKPGVRFTIRDGGRVVGSGEVLERFGG